MSVDKAEVEVNDQKAVEREQEYSKKRIDNPRYYSETHRPVIVYKPTMNDGHREIANIRRNDPEKTSLELCLRDFRDDPRPGEIADALKANDHFNELILNLSNSENVDWEPLLNVIGNREILHTVSFFGLVDAETMATLRLFLIPSHRNHAIHTVKFQSFNVHSREDGVIAAFLDACLSLTTFTISKCFMCGGQRERGQREREPQKWQRRSCVTRTFKRWSCHGWKTLFCFQS